MKLFVWTLPVLILTTLPIARAQDAQDDGDGFPSDQDTLPPAEAPELSVDSFYDALSPDGQWLDMAELGWCWRPSAAEVGADFQPYESGGGWIYTDDGWVFQSQWTWGDIVFHYGRWYQDASYGWLWVPGTDWAPAWVDWRGSDDDIGWIPSIPPGLGVAAPTSWWCFVAIVSFTSPNVSAVALPASQSAEVFGKTRAISQTVAVRGVVSNRGPSVKAIQRAGALVTVQPRARPWAPVTPPTAQAVHLTPLKNSRLGPHVGATVQSSSSLQRAAEPSSSSKGVSRSSRRR